MVRYHPFEGIKSKIVTDWLMGVPSIPVLHIKFVALLCLLFMACQYIPGLQNWSTVGINALRTLLEVAAANLRN